MTTLKKILWLVPVVVALIVITILSFALRRKVEGPLADIIDQWDKIDRDAAKKRHEEELRTEEELRMVREKLAQDESELVKQKARDIEADTHDRKRLLMRLNKLADEFDKSD